MPRYSEQTLSPQKGTLFATNKRAFAQRLQDASAKGDLYLTTLTGNGASDYDKALVFDDVEAHLKSGEQWNVDKMEFLKEKTRGL